MITIVRRSVQAATAEGFVEVLRDLDGKVKQCARGVVEARVMMGHVLNRLQAALLGRTFRGLVERCGVHRRRVTEAMRVAAKFARDDGSVNWDAYSAERTRRAHVKAPAEPSIRGMVALCKPDPAAAAEDAALDDGVEMLEEHAEPPAIEDDADLVDVDEILFEDEDEPVIVEEVGPVAAGAASDVASRTVAPTAAPGSSPGVVAGAWRVGAQMSMAALYERARDVLAELSQVVGQLGIDARRHLDAVGVMLRVA